MVLEFANMEGIEQWCYIPIKKIKENLGLFVGRIEPH